MKKLSAVLALVGAMLLLMVALALPAFASAPVSAKPPPTITLDAQTWAFAAGVVVPFLTALLAKNTASSGIKAVMNLIFSGIAGTIAVLNTNAGRAITVKELVIVIGTAWLMSMGTHLGFWKPVGATPAVNNATPNFGIGPSAKAA